MIEIVFNPKRGVLLLSAAALLFLMSCGATDEPVEKTEPSALLTTLVYSVETPAPDQTTTPKPTETPNPWTDEELKAMAQTLSGECYEDKEHDKRLVCEVILNRVSDGRFGDSICEVITAKNQFHGYWNPSRPVSENDLAIAEQALKDWFDNGCKALSQYLYFSAGENRENTFYENIEW